VIELREMREGGVAVLTLNRPAQLNAFTLAMTEGLRTALSRFAGRHGGCGRADRRGARLLRRRRRQGHGGARGGANGAARG